MSDEKLSEIANRSERSRVFFGKLRSNSQVFTYLKYLTQKSGPSGSEVEKNSMNEAFISRIIERIEALINELFKQDDIAKNIPYIASYYIEDPDERLWYLHMI